MAVFRRVKFKALKWIARWSLMKLWWEFKDDEEVDPHLRRHIVAAVEGGWETACTEDHCALDGKGRLYD